MNLTLCIHWISIQYG